MSEGSLASEKDPFLELLPHQHSKTMKKNTKQVGISDMLKEIVNQGNKCIVLNIRELATLSFIAQDATQMEKVTHSKNDENTFLQLRYVALALSQELKKICGQPD